MQIILTKEECEIIHEALITETDLYKNELYYDERRGLHDAVKHDKEMLYKIEQLMKRFEPYLKEKR